LILFEFYDFSPPQNPHLTFAHMKRAIRSNQKRASSHCHGVNLHTSQTDSNGKVSRQLPQLH